MKKFIELNKTIKIKVYINVDHITDFYRNESNSGRKFTCIKTTAGYNAVTEVIETPEEILKLINS